MEYRVLTVYGGVGYEDQTRELKSGVDFFVGTTGRVLDHIQRGNIDFSGIKTVILDEADQMLKLGFKEDVEKVLKLINISIFRLCRSLSSSAPRTFSSASSQLQFQDGSSQWQNST